MCVISDIIKKDRNNINDNSLNAYCSVLRKMKGDKSNFDFLNNYDETIELLNNDKITTKKNKLTAIIVYLKATKVNDKIIQKYNDKLKLLNTDYMNELKKQEKTPTQEQNWIDYNDIIKLVDKIMLNVKDQIIKKERGEDILTNKQFDLLQQAVILKTYLIFPLRNDFANMKIVNKNYKQDYNLNYLVKNNTNMSFSINNYKNRSRLGPKVYQIPPNLKKLINLWLKYNISNYFLVQSDRQTPMNPNNITKYLNKIFIKEYNKKISSSMIRHILISHINKDKPTILQKEEEQKAIENKFLHSELLNDLYRKK